MAVQHPCFNSNIKQKLKTRAQLRKQMPTPDILDRIRVLSTEIEEDIKHEQTTKCKQVLEGITYNTNSSKLWKLIRCLNIRNTNITDTHEAILTHAQTNIPTDTQQANILNTHYTNICRLPYRYYDRSILKRLHSITLDTNMTPPFTPIMTLHAICKTKNTSATGPDEISYLHLKHLARSRRHNRVLTYIFNLSLTTNSIPNIWKLAKIIPILKTHKPPQNQSLTDPCPSFATLLKY